MKPSNCKARHADMPFQLISRFSALALSSLVSVGIASAVEYRGPGFTFQHGSTAVVAKTSWGVHVSDGGILIEIVERKAKGVDSLLTEFASDPSRIIDMGVKLVFNGSPEFCAYGNWTGKTLYGSDSSGQIIAQAIAIAANGTTYIVMLGGRDTFERMGRFIAVANALRFDRVPKTPNSSSSSSKGNTNCPGCAGAVSNTMDTLTKQTTGMMK